MIGASALAAAIADDVGYARLQAVAFGNHGKRAFDHRGGRAGLAGDQGRHATQKAACAGRGSFASTAHRRFAAQTGALGHGEGCGLERLFLGACRPLGPPGAGFGERAGAVLRRPREQRHEAVIEHHHPAQQEDTEAAQLGRGRPENEKHHRERREEHQERKHLEPQRRLHGHDAQKRAEHGVAEKPAQSEGMAPVGSGHMGRGIDGGKRHGDRREDDARQKPILADVRQQTHAPEREDHGDRPACIADDDEEGRGDRGAEAAQKVPRRFVGGGQPARIGWRVRSHDHRRPDPEAEKDEPQKLGRAPFEHRLRVAVEKRVSLPCLIRHATCPSSGRGSRGSG